MRIRAGRNAKGFTLIELLVAMLVLSIGLMAMLDGLANYMRINIDNQMRNEAMRIAEATLETLRNARFGDVQTGAVVITTPLQRRFRNIPVDFAISWTRQNVSTSSVAIQVNVTWVHRGVGHQHSAASIISTDA